MDVARHGPVRVCSQPESLREHRDRLGLRSRVESDQDAKRLVDVLDEIGLTGHGGGHFPVARKWEAVRRAGGGGTVVANAAESEPISAKDAVLLQCHPHLVLDGLICAGEALGASRLVVWVHAGANATHRALVRALAERRHALVEPSIDVVIAPRTYLSGESSAVVRGLSGGPVLPEFRLVPSATQGVEGKPTLVQNVETLARVALAARATVRQPGTLLTVLTPRARSVVEVAPGSTLAQVVRTAGWPEWIRPQAVLVGGYGGTWLPWSSAATTTVAHQSLRPIGTSLGAGVIAAVPQDVCGPSETARVARYLAANGAGQCGPCIFGLPTLAADIERLAAGRARRPRVQRLLDLLDEVDDRGACRHPDGFVRMVRTALATFASDIDAHEAGHPCPYAAQPWAWLPIPTDADGSDDRQGNPNPPRKQEPFDGSR